MKITVVGGGFVGRATGSGLAKHKHDITFVDVDEKKIAELKKDGWQAVHPDQQTRITGDITMFCVPTPTKGGNIQLQYLKQAVTTFARLLRDYDGYHLAVIRSTVPPKTTRQEVLPLIERISGKKAGRDFGLAMQPEYLREATANDDYERPWFILIGELDETSGNMLEKVYRDFDAPIERCSLDEAEFQKYVHNIFNAVKIAFFNEMRIIAKKEGWNADKIFRAVAESSEGIWNPMYGLRDMGPFDGSCLPKDTRALLEWGEKQRHKLDIIRAVLSANMDHERVLGKNATVRVNYLADITV